MWIGRSVLATSALAALLGSVDAARAQEGTERKEADARTERNGSEQVTAEDVLRALQRQRPLNEVIPSASLAAKPDPSTVRTLRPEGSTIVELGGALVQEGATWLLQPACAGCTPLEILPNTQLEMMVRTMQGASEPISFIVSGEITVFENGNFLLAKYAARGAPVIEPPPVRSKDSPEQLPTNASAEDVLARLQTQKPEQDELPRASVKSALDRNRAKVDSQSLLLDGSPLVNLPGRLVREGSWWTLAFESDRPGAAEPPIRLLPNQALEMMIRTSKNGSIGLVLIVSGEATLYNGENYLMIRSVTRRMDLGNLHR